VKAGVVPHFAIKVRKLATKIRTAADKRRQLGFRWAPRRWSASESAIGQITQLVAADQRSNALLPQAAFRSRSDTMSAAELSELAYAFTNAERI